MSRPGLWIWMIAVMVLSGTGMTALLLFSPPGRDLTLVSITLLTVASALVAVPVSRTISRSMTAPLT